MTTKNKTNQKRLIFLSQNYDPEPIYKGERFINAWQKYGFDIEVVTGFPNYPGGVVYEGYNINFIQRESLKGTEVTRLPLYPSHDRNALKRFISYASFAASSLFYLLFGAKKADLIYVTTPTFTIGLSAAFSKMFRGTPVVIDIQDMWPDCLTETGMVRSSRFVRFVGWWCNLLYRHVDHIIVQSAGFKKLLENRGVSSAKISVIRNWADETQIVANPELTTGFNPNDTFRILFAGNMGTVQALSSVIEAARLLSNRGSNVSFYFLGDGVTLSDLKKMASDSSLTNVHFLPYVPMLEVPHYLAAADCLLVHLKSTPLFKVTIPSKLQAYMFAGKPIVMAVEGDAANTVLEAGAGLVCPAEDPEALVKTILEMQNLSHAQRLEMGLRGKDYYNQQLSMERHLQALNVIVRSLI